MLCASQLSMDQQLGRAFNAEIVRREIEAITDLGAAKRAALLIRNDWQDSDAL